MVKVWTSGMMSIGLSTRSVGPGPARRARPYIHGRDVSYAVSFGAFGEDLVFRMDGPLSSMRWALCSRRSQMASAVLGSPMTACQSATGI